MNASFLLFPYYIKKKIICNSLANIENEVWRYSRNKITSEYTYTFTANAAEYTVEFVNYLYEFLLQSDKFVLKVLKF